ncbi:Acetyltransferase (GNAT) family protein [Halobacillus alkaliphilus]|uniref:Acetyltransferase (GNAT) family protein n=1 Tax=Halobacillus alkaliphilus TaxID=396056 RepID=A0A1I2JR86_9BACI|nr:GNAT family N-acetyltransferase [Halobacillus alkaliphilus]SFF55201.1 Acetyltransferase (GNAT) family protein [Halobacillus alkaliphilus]
MVPFKNPCIVIKEFPNYDDYKRIKELMEVCIAHDNLSLKLELDYKLSHSSREIKDINKSNEFMFYEGETLIGYTGICQFGAEVMEVNGMVHPNYRRRGIFSRLYGLVEDEWRKRPTEDMLLLSDHHSHSGQAFIKFTGAHYDNSEYEMFLVNKPKDKAASRQISLRKAMNKDTKEIARQNNIYFQTDPSTGLTLPEEEAKHGVDIYLAELEQSCIGKVHLNREGSTGTIYGLGVLPEYRGRGYGREILLRCIEKLNEIKIHDIRLQVAMKNRKALSLYQNCGFEEASIMDYFKLSKRNLN